VRIAFTDVAYAEPDGWAACLLADGWTAPTPAASYVVHVAPVAAYAPGSFYVRELPCLLAALGALQQKPDVVVVDGYVWLDAAGRKGLGAHLYDALEHRIPVVGVAKTAFAGAAFARHVRRGRSQRPLYVTAAGLPVDDVAARVQAMAGPNRIPTLLGDADRLARAAVRGMG
jgi:deoxyribonuclease V